MNIIIDEKRDLPALLKDRLRILLHKVGVDRAVLLGILARLWNVIAAPVSLLFIAYKFSPQLQGYYYTFYSVIAFQFLLELGLSHIIIQFTSHEWSGLSLDKTGKIIGEQKALSRMQSLAQIFFRWYYITSIILTLSLIIGGYFFFSRSINAGINWMLPWFFLCICNGVAFCLIPIWSLLEGCNQVSKLYAYRIVQGIFLSLSLWISIMLGAQLWSAAISNAVVLICAGAFLRYKCRGFLNTLLFSKPASPSVKWHKEILPLQWRFTIEALIGPFAYTLFVPVLFKYHGPVIAGQMGMTWCIATMLISIACSWLNPKIPQFGMLIAKKRYEELDKLFWRTTKIISAVGILGAVVIWFMFYLLNEIKHPLATRFLPLLPTGLFLVSQIILIIGTPFSAYLRAHKKEPLLFVSVGAGISIGLSTLILGRYYSAVGMAAGYLLANLLFVPIVLLIWYYCRKKWHKDENADAISFYNNIATKKRIGIDFDNTIVTYDNVFHKYALKAGLISHELEKSKQAVRDAIRSLPNGNDRWTELQGLVYGKYIDEAEPMQGVEDFLKACKENSFKISIISHKTVYPALGSRVNLQAAAKKWLINKDFLSRFDLRESDIIFEETLKGKLDQIAIKGCGYFIDDLAEVLAHPDFPKGVKKIRYNKSSDKDFSGDITCVEDWHGIKEYFFG